MFGVIGKVASNVVKNVGQAAKGIQNATEKKPLTRFVRKQVGLNPNPDSGFESMKSAQKRATAAAANVTPETESGQSAFLEKFFPDVSAKLSTATAGERATAARDAIKQQIDADPDSIFHMLGIDRVKDAIREQTDMIRSKINSIDAMGSVGPEEGNLNPGTWGAGTAGLSRPGTLDDEFNQPY